MTRAHQIIYTSCRRGIRGSGDGLQVFSYDEGLPDAGLDVGVGFHRLLPFDVPQRAGATAFGYAPVEGCGAVWACNTKLAHDYMGPGGRAGNVLRHAVVLPLRELDFYPVELAGAGFWRRSMRFEEVNAEEPPAPLPPIDAAPAGVVDERRARWGLSGTRETEAAARLARATVLAASEGRAVAILADAEEALRWVALATYSLPLSLARQVSFVVGCDNLATAGAVLCGIDPAEFERTTPGYVRDACLTFDPREGVVRDASGVVESGGFDEGPYPRTLPGASFEALVERGWRECADEFVAFRDLCDRDLRLDLSLAALDGAVEAYRATTSGLHRVVDPAATLAFVERCGSERLAQLMVGIALGSVDKLDPAAAEEATTFVLRRWDGSDDQCRGYILAALTSMLMESPERSRAFVDALARCLAVSAVGAGAGRCSEDGVSPVAAPGAACGPVHGGAHAEGRSARRSAACAGGAPAARGTGGARRRPLFGGRGEHGGREGGRERGGHGGFPFGRGGGRR